MDLSRATMKKLMLLIGFGALALTFPQWIGPAARLLALLFGILSPFLVGAAMAFALNVPMRFIENKVLIPLTGQNDPKKKHTVPKGLLRAGSLLLTLVLVVLVILLLMLVVVPQLAVTVSGLGVTIQNAFARFLNWAELQFANNPHIIDFISELSLDWQAIDWHAILAKVVDFLKNGAGNVLTSTISAAKSVVSVVAQFFIALVFAVYILLQKEKLGRQFRKALYALAPKKAADYVVHVCSLSHKVFSSFITGQCTEAVILGTMFFITMTLMKMPYALLVGCVIAVTALIPIVGAFIGCALGAFLILMISPVQALVFVITFLILQQVEGNLIYPHVVGSSVGLPSIWVLAAVTVGGSLMGIAGMLLFIPFLSVVYSLFRDFVNRRLAEKHLDIQ